MENTNAPQNCVWQRQIHTALCWIKAFLSSEVGPLERVFELAPYLHSGLLIEFVLDASPWGIGGILTVNGHISEYMYEAIPTDVAELLSAKIGSSDSQQVFEALAVLAALRVWAHLWKRQAYHNLCTQ